MIDVIQILKSVERIEKSDYSTANRQLLDQLGDHFVSRTGYLTDQTLYLPSDTKQRSGLKTADLIIIQDINGFDPLFFVKPWDKANLSERYKDSMKSHEILNNQQLIYFNRSSRLWAFEIFKIGKNQFGSFDLHLNYSANESYIGIPKRENHKIAELKLNKPVRYKLNGKSDFTLTGRKQRSYMEYDYIIEYLGYVKKIEFKELSKIEVIKRITIESCKLIDERKILK